MSGRIAHRPRYRTTQQFAQPPRRARQPFLYARWTYRRQQLLYEKQPLGYSLSLLPFGYHLMQTVFPYRG